MRNPCLVGTKVYLRPLEEADAAECHAWLNDPDVRRTLAVGGVHVGNCGLHEIDPVDRHATLGIVIGRKDQWGQGLGTETVTLLCRHAFATLNLHKVCLSCYATNERGLRLYARAGFTVEGRRREQVFIDGRWVDEILLGFVRGDAPLA